MSRKLTIGLIAAVAVLTLGVASLAAFVFMRPAAAAEVKIVEVEKKAEAPTPLEFLALKNFVTDLADKERARYVDVTMQLGFRDAVDLAAAKKLEPQIRDIILGQLRTRVAADLAGATGKEKLAESLKVPLTELLKSTAKNGLKGIFITDLVVQ